MSRKRSQGSPTLRDVAELSGVHASTVSRALDERRRGVVRAEVVAAVTEIARRIGYRPNRAASSLRTGRTHTLGVLVPDITNPVFPSILQGIEACAAANGFFVLVANVGSEALVQPVLDRMLSQRVDGVLLATAARSDPAVDFLLANRLHAVLINRTDDSGRLSCVVSDDHLAMRLAVDHLVDRGCKRIAHLAGPQSLSTGIGRLQGFEAALRAHRMKPAGIAICGAYSRDAGRAAALDLLERRRDVDGLVCCNDLVALGAYDALRELKLRVPHDVRVTGHNDMPLVDMVDPPLTTVRLPHGELGWRATQLLLEAMDGRQLSPARVVLRPELVVRASTT